MVNNKRFHIDYLELYDRVVNRREKLSEILDRETGMRSVIYGTPLIDHVSYRTIKRVKQAIGAHKNTSLPQELIDLIVLEQTDEQGVQAGYKVLTGNVNERVQEILPGHYISKRNVALSLKRQDLDGVLYRDREYIQSRARLMCTFPVDVYATNTCALEGPFSTMLSERTSFSRRSSHRTLLNSVVEESWCSCRQMLNFSLEKTLPFGIFRQYCK
mmetsp:Transcript_7917/g.12696  ORF Transcript_7917/g.12696 Transcript_7917/m.12696 type:complete len:215 (-) Transcript_7917:598-1242(-)